MLNLNQLRAFYQTAKCMSFSDAARVLCVSQPAVTAQVKLFEAHCGVRLFIRRGRYLDLTEEGRIIYEHTRPVFEYEARLEEAIDRITSLKRGSLRLGTARTYARYFMPHLIATFHRYYPGIDIQLDEGSSRGMLESLVDERNQMVIVAGLDERAGVEYVRLCHEEVIPVLHPRHRLAGKRSISVQDLRDEPIIMKEAGSGTRKLVDELFLNSGPDPRVLMEISDAEMIKLLVQHGEGVSFLVREAVSGEISEGRLATVPLEGAPMILDVCAAYPAGSPLAPPARAFLGMLEGGAVPEDIPGGLNQFIAKLRAADLKP